MPILKQGSSGSAVKDLQQKLEKLGFDPKGIDGKFGPGTLAAVIAFQKSKGLTADGKVGPKTLAALKSKSTPAAKGPVTGTGTTTTTNSTPTGGSGSQGSARILSQADYEVAAKLLDCDVATIKAVAEVESRGAGFLADGRPKILFERHKFHSATGGRFDSSHPDISNRKPGGYGAAGDHQWKRFEVAAALDRDAAIRSCSWGKFQLMGFNFEVCGFASLEDFYSAMHLSEAEHLKAFCNFIIGNKLDSVLRKRNWAALAKGYNGKDYKINQYDTKLATAFAKYVGQ